MNWHWIIVINKYPVNLWFRNVLVNVLKKCYMLKKCFKFCSWKMHIDIRYMTRCNVYVLFTFCYMTNAFIICAYNLIYMVNNQSSSITLSWKNLPLEDPSLDANVVLVVHERKEPPQMLKVLLTTSPLWKRKCSIQVLCNDVYVSIYIKLRMHILCKFSQPVDMIVLKISWGDAYLWVLPHC